MKKEYNTPELQMSQLAVETTILAGSGNSEPVVGGGGSGTNEQFARQNGGSSMVFDFD